MSLNSIVDICLYYNYNFSSSILLSLQTIDIPKSKIINTLKSLWGLSYSSLSDFSNLSDLSDLSNLNSSYSSYLSYLSDLSLFRIIYNLKNYIPKNILKDLYWHILKTNVNKCYPGIFNSIYELVIDQIQIDDITLILKCFESYQGEYIFKNVVNIMEKYTKVPFCIFHTYQKINNSILNNHKVLKKFIIYIFEIQGFQIPDELFSNHNDDSDWITTHNIKHNTKYNADDINIISKLPKLIGKVYYKKEFIRRVDKYIRSNLALKRIEWYFLSILELPNRSIIQKNMSFKVINYILNENTTLVDIVSSTKKYKCLKLLQLDIGNILLGKIFNINNINININKNEIYEWYLLDKYMAIIILSECIKNTDDISTNNINTNDTNTNDTNTNDTNTNDTNTDNISINDTNTNNISTNDTNINNINTNDTNTNNIGTNNINNGKSIKDEINDTNTNNISTNNINDGKSIKDEINDEFIDVNKFIDLYIL